jgi:putative MATE family efflux protein
MKNKSKRKDLTKGNLEKQILFMTLPMILGMLGMVIFNFVDALYIGKLGETELAAIAFTFPVVLVIQSISQGLSMGTGSVVSKFAGEKNEDWVKKTSTYSLVLSFSIVVVFSIIGHLTIEPLFKLLGATSNEMPYIKSYMRIWYFGMPFVVIPMVGNNIIRALGDTKIPSLVMTIAAVLNMILDPILIFGWGFEGLGIAGAAIATVFARFITFSAAIYILTKREKVLSFKDVHFKEFLCSCKSVLYIAVPTSITRGVIPIGMGIITALIATFGALDVAGYGAGVKIENLGMSVVNALSVVMVAVTGQNFGAKNFDRVKSGYKIACSYSLLYSFIIIPIFFFTAPLLSKLFDVIQPVRDVIIIYVRLAVLGIGFFGVLNISSALLNAVRKPIIATLLFLFEMFGLYIPSAFIFSKMFGTQGVFYGLIIAYVISGIISYIVTTKIINKNLA